MKINIGVSFLRNKENKSVYVQQFLNTWKIYWIPLKLRISRITSHYIYIFLKYIPQYI